MPAHPPVESEAPPRPGKHREEGIANAAVKNFVRNLVPCLLVFFAIQNVGLRPLRYFCEQFLQFPISVPDIEKVICRAGKNAERRLAPLDLKAGELVSAVEVDTTWKGRSRKFLAAIAREGNYLFCLAPVQGESAAAVQPHLGRLAQLCCNLRVVVTDMALGFEKAIPRLFRGVVHLFCHNHLLKGADRELPEVRKGYLDAKKKLAKKEGPVKTVQKWLDQNRERLYNVRSYRKKLQQEKVAACRQHGIPVKPSGALQVTSNGLPPFLRELSARIGRAQAKEARYKSQVARQLAKKAKVGPAAEAARQVYHQAWHRYAAARRIFALFKQVLRATTMSGFRRLRQQLERTIAGSPSKLAAKVGEYLQLPQLWRYFALSPEVRAALGPVNTNRVEGFFAQMRVTLDGLRNAPDTPYVRARLALLRYWHNVVGPLSGPNAGISPCRALGIVTRPGNPVQAICAGAPLPSNIPATGNWPASAAGVRA